MEIVLSALKSGKKLKRVTIQNDIFQTSTEVCQTFIYHLFYKNLYYLYLKVITLTTLSKTQQWQRQTGAAD